MAVLGLLAASVGAVGPASAVIGRELSVFGGAAVHELSSDGSSHIANATVDGAEQLVRHERGSDAAIVIGPAAQTVALSSDGEVVIALGRDDVLRVFDDRGLRSIDVAVDGPLGDLVTSDDGRFVGFSGPKGDGGVETYRLDRSNGAVLRLPSEAGESIRPVGITATGERILIWRTAAGETDIGQLGVFDIAALTLTKVTVDPVEVVHAVLTSDGARVVFASPERLVEGVPDGLQLYETDLAERIIRHAPTPFALTSSLVIAPSGQVLAQPSTSDSRRIDLFDRRSRTQWSLEAPGADSGGTNTPVAISGDDRAVLIARSADTADVLDTGVVDPGALLWDVSDRPLPDALERMYRTVLGRPADGGGLAFWEARAVGGEALAPMAKALLNSAEGRARHGEAPSVTGLVDRTLLGLLGREPTGRERRYWLDQAGEAGSIEAFLVQLSQSPLAERATQTSAPQATAGGKLTRLYRAVFGRFPDPQGYRYWAQLQGSGFTLDQLIDQFAVSSEFEARLGADPASNALIDQLYRNVLGRPADEEGLTYWQTQLAAGASRNVMIASFVDSEENIRRTGTTP